jgi:uncharacterized protein (DUF488 family)
MEALYVEWLVSFPRQDRRMKLKRLATIGYEGASIQDFLATLQAAGVTTLLDVREFAGSRRKGFAKTALRQHLAGIGIEYRHEPALGSPRDIRHQLREDGRHDRFFRDFDRYLATQQPLLKQLARELTGTVALLCYERNYQECHRKSVAAALGTITGLTPKHHGVQPHGHRQAHAPSRAHPGEGLPAA